MDTVLTLLMCVVGVVMMIAYYNKAQAFALQRRIAAGLENGQKNMRAEFTRKYESFRKRYTTATAGEFMARKRLVRFIDQFFPEVHKFHAKQQCPCHPSDVIQDIALHQHRLIQHQDKMLTHVTQRFGAANLAIEAMERYVALEKRRKKVSFEALTAAWVETEEALVTFRSTQALPQATVGLAEITSITNAKQ